MGTNRGRRAEQSDWYVAAALRTELLFAPRPRTSLGVGPLARTSLTSRLDSHPVHGVLLIGFSGALRATLGVGDLVVADHAFDAEGDLALAPEAVARAVALLPDAHVGSVVTAPRVAPPEEKARLGLTALAVDMESALVARELATRGVPLLVLRVVLDALWEEAPRGMARLGWSMRALACSRRLGQAACLLASALPGATNGSTAAPRLHDGGRER